VIRYLTLMIVVFSDLVNMLKNLRNLAKPALQVNNIENILRIMRQMLFMFLDKERKWPRHY